MKPNSTQNIDLQAWVNVASAAASTPAAYDLYTSGQGKFSARVNIWIGRRTGSAFTATWPRIEIWGSHNSTSGPWVPLTGAIVPAIGSSIANTTLSAGVSAGASSISVASATNIAAGDDLFIGDSSESNYETARVLSVSGTTINLLDALLNNHSNGAVVTDQAEIYSLEISIAAIRYIRVVCNNQSGQNIAFRAGLAAFDSIS